MESAQAKGRSLPDWYLEQPILLPGDEFYLHEFWIMHTERSISSGGFGPIPVSRLEDRAEKRHGLQGQDLELYLLVVRSMDEAFLGWKREEYERESQKS